VVAHVPVEVDLGGLAVRAASAARNRTIVAGIEHVSIVRDGVAMLAVRLATRV